MIELVLVCTVAFGASALTLFSGFGLGTLLLPVFAIFFPIDVAVAVTAVVHLGNNLVKVALFGRHADRTVLRRFVLPAILAALLGARVLTRLSSKTVLATYSLGGHEYAVTPVGVVIGGLVAVFALWEAVPRLARVSFDPRYLAVGGGLSGFFGGLSGHQGALRSAFLIRCGLEREAYIGTGVVIAVLVDITRLSLYGHDIGLSALRDERTLAIAGVLSAIAGVVLAKRLVPRVSMTSIRRLVAVMLLLVAIAVASGIV